MIYMVVSTSCWDIVYISSVEWPCVVSVEWPCVVSVEWPCVVSVEWPFVIQTIIQRGEGRGRRTLGERASERECRGESGGSVGTRD